jgi:hypothetical protein
MIHTGLIVYLRAGYLRHGGKLSLLAWEVLSLAANFLVFSDTPAQPLLIEQAHTQDSELGTMEHKAGFGG